MNWGSHMREPWVYAGVLLLPIALASANAQHAPGQHFSPNVKLVAHVPLDAQDLVADIEIEQELSRPYAYVTRERQHKDGFQIINLKDPAKEIGRAHV